MYIQDENTDDVDKSFQNTVHNKFHKQTVIVLMNNEGTRQIQTEAQSQNHYAYFTNTAIIQKYLNAQYSSML